MTASSYHSFFLGTDTLYYPYTYTHVPHSGALTVGGVTLSSSICFAKTSLTPNNDAAMDSAIISLAHELAEVMITPYKSRKYFSFIHVLEQSGSGQTAPSNSSDIRASGSITWTDINK